MTTTTDRTRPKRRHAARRARWVTAGLAVSGTLGIAGYLEVQQLVADSSASTLTLNQAVPSNTVPSGTAPTTPTPPAAPHVRIVVVHRDGTVTSTAPVRRSTPTTTPTRTPVTSRPSTQATTRGSAG